MLPLSPIFFIRRIQVIVEILILVLRDFSALDVGHAQMYDAVMRQTHQQLPLCVFLNSGSRVSLPMMTMWFSINYASTAVVRQRITPSVIFITRSSSAGNSGLLSKFIRT